MGVEFVGLTLVWGCLLRPGRSVVFCWVILVVGMGRVRFVWAVRLRVGVSSRWHLGCVSVVSCWAGCG